MLGGGHNWPGNQTIIDSLPTIDPRFVEILGYITTTVDATAPPVFIHVSMLIVGAAGNADGDRNADGNVQRRRVATGGFGQADAGSDGGARGQL